MRTTAVSCASMACMLVLQLTQASVGDLDPNCQVESVGVDGTRTKRPCYDAGITVAEVKDTRAYGRFESCTGASRSPHPVKLKHRRPVKAKSLSDSQPNVCTLCTADCTTQDESWTPMKTRS